MAAHAYNPGKRRLEEDLEPLYQEDATRPVSKKLRVHPDARFNGDTHGMLLFLRL
jgi:hypothetical protein